MILSSKSDRLRLYASLGYSAKRLMEICDVSFGEALQAKGQRIHVTREYISDVSEKRVGT